MCSCHDTLPSSTLQNQGIFSSFIIYVIRILFFFFPPLLPDWQELLNADNTFWVTAVIMDYFLTLPILEDFHVVVLLSDISCFQVNFNSISKTWYLPQAQENRGKHRVIKDFIISQTSRMLQ